MPSHHSATVHQLRPSADPDEVNVEALALSALLSHDQWRAPAMGVTDEMFVTFGRVFEFCDAYARSANGSCPPLEVVSARFPELEIVPDYSLDFAVKELKDAHVDRVARIHMHAAATALAKGDMAGYRAQLLAATKESAPEVRPISVADEELWNQKGPSGYDVDDGLLTAFTGGIKPGDFWLFAARLAAGKSWRLVDVAMYVALQGVKVTYFSLEMTAPQVAHRALNILGKGRPVATRDLRKALEEAGGDLSVFDPSHGRTTPDVIASAAGDGPRLAVIDHLGLMFSSKGTRSIDDWRVAADISNTVKEVALSYKLPVLGAAQINRTGASSLTAPAAHQLAGTDAYGQDADVIMTMRRASERVMVNRLAKNRWGQAEKMWYSKFIPASGEFGDLPTSTAHEWMAGDDDRNESQL
jgi:hypothetical protein